MDEREGGRADGEPKLPVAWPGWWRSWAGVMLILVVGFGILALFSNLTELGRPFAGYLSYGYISNDVSHAVYETPVWWSPVVNGQIQHGDRLMAINDLPYTPNARREFEHAYAADRTVDVLVERQETGEQVHVELPVKLLTVGDFLDFKVPDLLVAVAFWLLALMVLRARPESATNQVFAVAAALVAMHRLGANTSVTTDANLIVNLPRVGLSLAAGLLGPVLIHLALVFPTPLPRQPRALLALGYALGLGCGIGLAMTRLPFWAVVSPEAGDLVDQVCYRVMMYLLLAGIVALFARLIWSWFRQRQTRRQRRAAGFVAAGLLFALPAVAYFVAPIFLGFEDELPAFWRGLDLRYWMLAIPIAFAYVIIRYQTFQSLSRLFIFVLVLSLSGMLAAVGSWIWGVTQPPAYESVRPPFVTLFGLIFAASLFWSSQASWHGWFGRYLHWEQRSYDSARSFGERVMGKTSLNVLPQAMARALLDELTLERAAVWLWQADRRSFVLAGSAGATEPPLPPILSGPGRTETISSRALRANLPELLPVWLQPLAGHSHIEAVVTLAADGAPVGLLGLGQRWDEEVFDDRDLAVAELVGQQATLFVLAATQVEELRRVPDRVAQAQERERLRLAGELHDTIQQFLGRLPFFLAVSRDLIRADPTTAAGILDRCLTDVEENAALLRGIRVNLAPNQLETSLARPLQGLVAHVQQRWPHLRVELNVRPDLDAGTTQESRHALYRVVQQALDNAIAHAEAECLSVSVWRENGRVQFAVQDDGRGSSDMDRQSAEAEGSFGLKSMKARLEMCGGSFGFESAPGQGTRVYGWVPAAANDAAVASGPV